MRRCLYILLILLLPLRGLVGDAMATQMALPQAGAHAVATAGPVHDGHAAEPAHAHAASAALGAGDCAGHGGQNESAGAHDASHCGECAMCQTCHTVAVMVVAEIPGAGQQHPAVPRLAATGFTSADRALALKPPTS